MIDPKNPSFQDRRADVRLASDRKIDAVVVDQHEQPIAVLRGAQVVNVSAGGVMMESDRPADQGARIVVNLDSVGALGQRGRRFQLEALECVPARGQKHQIRCKLIDGAIPARLIYNW